MSIYSLKCSIFFVLEKNIFEVLSLEHKAIEIVDKNVDFIGGTL
jgi:hypothetical protein